MPGASSRLILRRIDAACEQCFESGVDAGALQRALDQCVETESRDVALVEDDRMAEVDRPAVIRGVSDEIEQRLRSRAIARIPLVKPIRGRLAARLAAEARRSCGHAIERITRARLANSSTCPVTTRQTDCLTAAFGLHMAVDVRKGQGAVKLTRREVVR